MDKIKFTLLVCAGILGIGMLLLPDYRQTVHVQPSEVVLKFTQAKAMVSLATLDKWITTGKKDFLLIDLRTPLEFSRGHIQGAKNFPLEKMAERRNLIQIESKTPIILYGQGEAPSAIAWVLLHSMGKKAYFLQGGYLGWLRFKSGGKMDDTFSSQKTTTTEKTNYEGKTTGPKPKKPVKKPTIQTSEEEEGC